MLIITGQEIGTTDLSAADKNGVGICRATLIVGHRQIESINLMSGRVQSWYSVSRQTRLQLAIQK